MAPTIGSRSIASSRPRVEILLFSLAVFCSAYFHQGGGWNQNARFALVRAIVEERTFVIDRHGPPSGRQWLYAPSAG